MLAPTGVPGREKSLTYFPEAHYTLVEPQDHLKVHIQDLLDRGCKITWINAGAADKAGMLPFTTYPDRDVASTFDPGGCGCSANFCSRNDP